MKIKICGITSLPDARFAAAAGADLLGYIQARESPRYIDPELVADINAWVSGLLGVGVFVDEDYRTINSIVRTARFDVVQLHGRESVATCEAVDCSVIKAFRVKETDTVDELRRRMEPYLDCVDYILLDSYNPALRGGTGTIFPWKIARELTSDFPILLAGGLGPDNIAEAIRTVQPTGVDASSKLEESPGIKDFDAITSFIERARSVSGNLQTSSNDQGELRSLPPTDNGHV